MRLDKQELIKGNLIVSEKDTIKLIRFTKAVPKFLSPDLKTYGPFEQEDILNID